MLLRESIELNIREYMGLAETLVSIPQSERGGEIAQRGFDYQTCWALSQMLEYELDEKNYVFIFEYHDDVLILDDEVSPTQLTFAQVKQERNTGLHPLLVIAPRRTPYLSSVSYLFIKRISPNIHPSSFLLLMLLSIYVRKTVVSLVLVQMKSKWSIRRALRKQSKIK